MPKMSLKTQTLAHCLGGLNAIIDNANLSTKTENEAKALLEQIERLLQNDATLSTEYGLGCQSDNPATINAVHP
jgi:hypothetical protein